MKFIVNFLREVFSPKIESVSDARELLKQATSLKKSGKYLEACEKLKIAYAADDSDQLMIEEKLRLPMYLLLAGKNEEGWNLIVRMYEDCNDFNKSIIYNQIKIFIKKEAKNSKIVRVMPTFHEPADVSKAILKPDFLNQCDDLLMGWEFHATLQLRTPLRILNYHGKFHQTEHDIPQIVKQQWEGVWLPKSKPIQLLNGDEFIFPEGTVAGPYGPVLASKVLPFLISVRSIVESTKPLRERFQLLINEVEKNEWQEVLPSYGGRDEVVNFFFPYFTDTIPSLSTKFKNNLIVLGFKSPADFIKATDSELLQVPGLGKGRLTAIRNYVSTIKVDHECERLDLVTR